MSLKYERDSVIYENEGMVFSLPLYCPEVKINGQWYCASFPSSAVTCTVNNIAVIYNIDCTEGEWLTIRVVYEFSDKDGAMRKFAEITPDGFSDAPLIEEVIVEKYYSEEIPKINNLDDEVSSFPFYFKNMFAALEFPYAVTGFSENTLKLGHMPSVKVENGCTYKTKSAIFCLTGGLSARDAFFKYISKNRPETAKVQTNYNSWWSIPFPFSEQQVLGLMSAFKENLYDKYAVSFDTFAIDMGWSKVDGVWEINTELFPNGFDKIKETAESMGSKLGLWISPSNCYSPHAFDNMWAKEQGYEFIDTPATAMCLAGTKYKEKFKKQLVEYVCKYDIMHIKFDGIVIQCKDESHGHVTSGGERELIAESIIDVFKELNSLKPGIWLEATCFGNNASPFWLNYCSSVLGTYGDDSPNGTLPCPKYRESATSGRDYFNLQGADRLTSEIKYQELLGVVHQSDEDFTNDLINVILRGNTYIPFYINPERGMTQERYERLAAVLKWIKNNDDLFENTIVLNPESFKNLGEDKLLSRKKIPAEAYGYAHWRKDSGIIMLRNPFVEKVEYSFGLPEKYMNGCLYSIYPEARDYNSFKKGNTVTVPLAPYETLILVSDTNEKQLPKAEDLLYNSLLLNENVTDKIICGDKIKYIIKGRVTSNEELNELMFLIYDSEEVIVPSDLNILVNGNLVEPKLTGSADGFTATQIKQEEFWQFAVVPLKKGACEVEISFTQEAGKTSATAVYTASLKMGNVNQPDSPLPQPEYFYNDSVVLFSKDLFKNEMLTFRIG